VYDLNLDLMRLKKSQMLSSNCRIHEVLEFEWDINKHEYLQKLPTVFDTPSEPQSQTQTLKEKKSNKTHETLQKLVSKLTPQERRQFGKELLQS
jgi:hypothetical protein